ncbi:MAG: methyltransferase domain-containing protein [Marinoscillum sp.]
MKRAGSRGSKRSKGSIERIERNESLVSTESYNNDTSNGWEAIAKDFISIQDVLTGKSIIADWDSLLGPGQDVLDVGCGFGGVYTKELIDKGIAVYGIDASGTLVNEYKKRYPSAIAQCESAEESSLYHRKYDGIVSIGMMFLLPVDNQLLVLQKMANALKPGGKILFTSPYQICEWDDLLTGRKSTSLGRDSYENELRKYGLSLGEEYTDEGGNHYYSFQ